VNATLLQPNAAAALAMTSGEVTGPGIMFPALFPLPPDDDFAHFGYEAREYFVSGTANAKPYKTRIVVRKPIDASRFSGFPHRSLLDLGDTARYPDDDPRAHKGPSVVDLSDEIAEHRLRDLKIRDDTVLHGTDRHNVTGGATKHHLGLFADGQDIRSTPIVPLDRHD